MSKRKRKKAAPRMQGLTRKRRLQAAKSWLQTFDGKHVARAYSKWFGVDRICAVIELQMLGVPLDPAYVEAVRKTARAQSRPKPRPGRDTDEWFGSPDEPLGFIVGFTAGGAPFGLSWEALDRQSHSEWPERTS